MWRLILGFTAFLILAAATPIQTAEQINVVALTGSTRADSLNKKLVINAANYARAMGATVTVIDLKDFPIPFYDADIEATTGMPQNALRLRQILVGSQAIFIASPEYNASVSAVLKNAIDWTSRGENGGGSRDAFKGKNIAIMSVSPGKNGGKRGLTHLREILEDVGGKVISQQVVVGNGYSAFDEQGNLIDPKVKTHLQQLVKKALN